MLLIQSQSEDKLLVMCFSESLYTSNNICKGSKYLKKPSKMNRNVIQSITSTSSSCNDMGKAWIPTFCDELWDMVELEELQK